MARPTLQKSLPSLMRTLRHFWPWIRQERAVIASSTAALLVGVSLRLLEPWPLKFVLDRVIPVGRPKALGAGWLDDFTPMTILTLAAAAIVVFTGLRALCDYLQKVGFARIGNRVLRRVRDHAYRHLQGLSLSFHNKARRGDLIIRVTRDVSLLRDVASTAMLPLFANCLVLLGMATIMAVLEWRLALLVAATIPFFFISTVRTGRGIHEAARKQRRREGAMAATASESINAIESVQALSLEESFAEDFSSRNKKSQKEDLKAARLSAKLGRTVDLLLGVATAVVVWVGARFVLDGNLTPGDLVVFLAYVKRAFKPVKDFAKYTGRLAKAAAAGERVREILEREPEVRDLPGARPAPELEGCLRFDQVDFAYEPGELVLREIDFEAKPGAFVALTGRSGIGKSTLVGLIMRLYDPIRGRVLIDDSDIRDYTLKSLRPQISVVLQDTVLFHATVAENIAMGAPDATPAEVEAAARLANAHDFISDFPDGYETLVGERGVNLSHGQRQRISVARAAIRRTPILILDEPTTGLDGESRHAVAEALVRLAKGRTTFLVTHDLQLASRADCVLFIEGGTILERGSPRDLLAAEGRFASLYRLQHREEQSHVR